MTVAENDTADTPDDQIDAEVEVEDDSDAEWPQLPQIKLDVCLAAEDTQPGLQANMKAIRAT